MGDIKLFRLQDGQVSELTGKSKVGVNKDLVNIKTMLNDAANRG